MNKEERYVWQLRENWYDIIYDKKTNKRLRTDKESIVALLNQQDQRIAELEEQLKNARKETAKKVIDRVEELSVFDFKACKERYIISEMELDNILKEYGE